MQQGNITSINWNANNYFNGYVLDNNIYTYSGELIGVNLAKYQEVEAGLQKCRDKLVELGVIKPEKTPEEIIKEQAELLEKQAEMCKSLMEQMQEMTQKIERVNYESGTNKRNSKSITDTEPNEAESTASVRPSLKDNKSGKELHKG